MVYTIKGQINFMFGRKKVVPKKILIVEDDSLLLKVVQPVFGRKI